MSAEEKLIAMMKKNAGEIMDSAKQIKLKKCKRTLIWNTFITLAALIYITLSHDFKLVKCWCICSFIVILFSELYGYCLKKDVINGENHFL
jgi:hypothetical protein